MIVMVDSIQELLEAILRSQLLEPGQYQILQTRLATDLSDPCVLAMRLVKRGWLTVYQAEELLEGEGKELVLGPYRVLSLIGEGGLCKVFKAFHTELHQLEALKVLHPELRGDPEVQQQFRQEMEILARLEHPCFVKGIDVDLRRPGFYFAMDYIDGIDLHRLVKHAGPLPVAQACNYFAQAALGLEYAYERGLVHRDIKPANLVVTFAGNEVRILDIGLARLEWETARTDQRAPALMGTADYIAPEQALNPEQANVRADIYSLGCSLYHVLAGQPPYFGKSLAQKLLHHQQSPAPSLRQARSEVPEELARIVQRMMAKNPEERYRTPASVAVALLPFTRRDEPEVSIEQFRELCSSEERTLRINLDETEDAGPGAPPPGETPPPGTGSPTDSPGFKEQRTSLRRWGNPISIQLYDEMTMNEPLTGWVINRSTGGLGMIVNAPLEVGSVLGVRPAQEGVDRPWVSLRIVYCYPERSSWRAGGAFLVPRSWRDIRIFG